MTDVVVDQVATDLERLALQHAAELRDLAQRQAGERAALVARLRSARPTASAAVVLEDAAAEPARPPGARRYSPGPLPAKWEHVSKLADLLNVRVDTAWRIAHKAEAQWPFKARRVDTSKFADILPDLRKIDKLAS